MLLPGFPGDVAVVVTYTLTDEGEVIINYEGVALNKPTPISMGSHFLFNLAGQVCHTYRPHETGR